MANNKRFYIRTYGCQMNLYDEGIVKEILRREGYEPTEEKEEASLILVLTCSVRKHAENRALGFISSLAGLKSEDPEKRIGVLGCMATAFGEKLLSYGADFILGPNEYKKLPKILRGQFQSPTLDENPESSCETYEDIQPKAKGIKAYLAIMRGCSNFCSYCIVPYCRGKERSKEFSNLLEEAKRLVAEGVKEITLIGQNVLGYQSNGLTFLDILKELNKIDGLKRIRFLTSHPKDLSFSLIEEMALLISQGKLCPEFHLPLQSGSNRILSLMNRGYTKEEYLKKINHLRSFLPDVAITTDLMVGFPSEEEDDFQETMAMVENIRFDFAYMFKYSERPFTRANSLQPKVKEEIKGRRLSHLIEVQNRITKERNEEMRGKVFPVLIEDKIAGEFRGKTPQGKMVVIKDGGEKILGEIYPVKIVGLNGWTPIGQFASHIVRERSDHN